MTKSIPHSVANLFAVRQRLRSKLEGCLMGRHSARRSENSSSIFGKDCIVELPIGVSGRLFRERRRKVTGQSRFSTRDTADDDACCALSLPSTSHRTSLSDSPHEPTSPLFPLGRQTYGERRFHKAADLL